MSYILSDIEQGSKYNLGRMWIFYLGKEGVYMDLNILKVSDNKPMDDYDDGNIPQVDLPQDIIPDEVPRKDGPGGEGSKE